VIIDARLGAGGKNLDADVCVVGAGPVGIAVALSLVERGLEVIVLEAGSIEPDVDSQRFAAGEIAGRIYDPLDHARGRSFGGSARLWNVDLGGGMPGARMRRFDAIDFIEREWVPYSGWPFPLEALIPFYEQAESFFGIEGQAYFLPSTASDSNPFGDKQSPLECTIFRFATVEPILDRRQQIMEESKLTVLLNAIVVELERVTGSEEIARLHAMSLTGNDYAVHADAYVLATGGIENARILLMTDLDGEGQRGIGNQYGLVGRFFMEHPHTRAGFVLPRDTDQEFLLKEVKNFGEALGEPWFRVRDEVAAKYRFGNMAVGLKPVPPSEVRRVRSMGRSSQAIQAVKKLRARASDGSRGTGSLELMKAVLRGGPEIAGASLRKAWWLLGETLRGANQEHGMSLRIDVMSEQTPNPESRVTLSSQLDPIGMPRATLNWKLVDRDFDALTQLSSLVADLVKRRGIGKLAVPFERSSAPVNWGFHHMGTTRMHSDPTQGVVDEFGRVHEMENLYIAGSSVFPTGGVSNPTLTAVALSLRLADHIAEKFGKRN
jgi:choline dehydrogenase-like flavoprotein